MIEIYPRLDTNKGTRIFDGRENKQNDRKEENI